MALGPHQHDQLRRLTEISRLMTNAASLDEILELAVDQTRQLLAADRALLTIVDGDGQLLVRASRGVSADLIARLPPRLDADLEARLGEVLGRADFLAVPLVMAGAVRGFLAVDRSPPAGTEDGHYDEWLLSALADQAALALERSSFDEDALLRERLLGIVGHDLRNPLNAIVMAADVLGADDGSSPQVAKLAARIGSSVRRMTWILDQLADFTRVRLGGGMPLHCVDADLHALCAGVIDELTIAHPAAEIVHRRGAGDATGWWDAGRIEQLISNLVGNAIQHGATGRPIQVMTQAIADEAVLTVHNAGDPIPDALRATIFDPFRQATASGRPARSASLGLGLYIAQEIARAHGGEISCESTRELGTRFTLRMPRRAA